MNFWCFFKYSQILEDTTMTESPNQFIEFVSENSVTIVLFINWGENACISSLNARFSNFHWTKALYGRHFRVYYYFFFYIFEILKIHRISYSITSLGFFLNQAISWLHLNVKVCSIFLIIILLQIWENISENERNFSFRNSHILHLQILAGCNEKNSHL